MEKKNEKPSVDYEVVEEKPWMDSGGGNGSNADANDYDISKWVSVVIIAIFVLCITSIILAII